MEGIPPYFCDLQMIIMLNGTEVDFLAVGYPAFDLLLLMWLIQLDFLLALCVYFMETG